MQFPHKTHRVHILLALCTLLAGLFITACSSPLLNERETAEDMPSIDVIVTNYADKVNSIARLISPDTYGIVQKYTIDGEDIDGFQLSYDSFRMETNGTGKISGVSKTLWNLTLHAYFDAAGEIEVLRAYATADTRNGDTEVSFTLSPYDVTTNGSYTLTFTYPNTEAFASVTQINFSVCNSDTGEALYKTVVTDPEALSQLTAGGYTLTRSNVSSGYYLLLVEFWSNSSKIGTYTDLLDIKPGLMTSSNVEIPNILNSPPAAPTNLKVYRDDATLNKDSYNAVIRWDDNSTNEEYFEITVYEYADLNSATGTPVKIINRENFATLSSVNGDEFSYAGGNILYGSTEYVLKVKTGKLYDFTITAVNEIGRSAEVMRTASETISTDSASYALGGFETAESAPYSRINTCSITYGLGDGIWQTGAAITYVSQTMMGYYIYTGSPVTLQTPHEIVTSGIQLYPIAYLGSTQNPWTGWTQNGSDITEISGCKNSTVFAKYDVTETNYDLAFNSNGLSLEYGTTDTGLFTSAADGDTVTSSNCKYIRVTIDKTKNTQFTRFIVYVNGSEQGDTNAGTETEEYYVFAAPLKGTYTVQVAGVCNNTKYFSSEKTLKVN